MLGIDNRALRMAWTVFLFGLFLTVVWMIRTTIGVFAAAVFFAYILSPLVGLIERFIKRQRTLALAIVYCAFIGLLVLIGFQLIPALAEQAVSLATRLPSLVSGGNLSKMPLPGFLEPMREQVRPILTKAATNLESSVVPFLREAGARLLSGLGALLPAILVPILAFFFLKDARTIRNALVNSFDDEKHVSLMNNILDGIHTVLRNYIRALVLLSVASFAAWGIFLSLFHYSYELLLAGVSAVLEFIPVVGPITALVVVLSVCLATGSGGIVWIIVFWAAFRLFQDYVLQPYLMSSGIELHPMLVLFGVLAGEALGGVPGMFFSVPILAILKVVYEKLRERNATDSLNRFDIGPAKLVETQTL